MHKTGQLKCNILCIMFALFFLFSEKCLKGWRVLYFMIFKLFAFTFLGFMLNISFEIFCHTGLVNNSIIQSFWTQDERLYDVATSFFMVNNLNTKTEFRICIYLSLGHLEENCDHV